MDFVTGCVDCHLKRPVRRAMAERLQLSALVARFDDKQAEKLAVRQKIFFFEFVFV